MFNEIRSWLRPADSSEPVGRHDIRFVETPSRRACFVLDQDTGSSQTLSGVLQSSGLETSLFSNGPAFIEGLGRRTPDLVFLDVPENADETIDAVFALGESGYRGPVQLLGGPATQVTETVKRMGQRHSLQMLPALKKPIDTSEIRQLLRQQGFEGSPAAPLRISLNEALKNNWIEFWYQPKIDLRKKQIAGVETFARVRHPELGTLPPGAFMPGADEQSLTALAERGLVSALRAASNFSQLGINLRLAVNISLSALASLQIADMVRQYGPKKTNWPGLILDVTEEQIVSDLAMVCGIAERLSAYSIRLAIDDFGRGHLSLASLRELPFAELKLDRAFVNNCSTEKTNAAICKTVVDLAHNFGSVAVAIGVEKASDVHTLQGMGCDLGQGYLFGQPMPEEQLVALLRERAVMPKRPQGAQRVPSRA